MEYETKPKAPEIGIYYKKTVSDVFNIKSPKDVFELMMSVEDMIINISYRELFYILYLNSANDVIAIYKLSEGTSSKAPVDIKFIMQGAIMTNCEGIIMCHSHPSGKLYPSRDDHHLNDIVKNTSGMFGVKLVDSIVISNTDYYSCVENGLL